MKSNSDIRDYAKSKGVRLWQVAEELKTTEFSFSRKLRHELSDSEKSAVFSAIDRAAEVLAQA